MKKFYIIIVKKEGQVPSKYYYLTKQKVASAAEKFTQEGYTVTQIITDL